MANRSNINLESMLRTGTILHGTYRIESYLSSGGFGNTYVATHTLFGTKRAIKEFFMKGVTQRTGNTSMVSVSNSENVDEFTHQLEKFKKEARRLFELDNKNIVKVHDLFEENGTAYYVMDYIDGEDLRRWLEHEKRPMTEDEVMTILPQVLHALEDVHSKGIWHLDLKPANIMVDGNMAVKLIDFGASKQFDSQRGGVTSSAVAFTNGYAPFEQMEKNHEKFGPWTDFYALGATLYNLLTNKKPPLPSDINDDHSDDKHLALPMPSSLSAKLHHLVLWLMKTNRQDRPSSVKAIQDFLNNDDSLEKTSGIDDETIVEQSDNAKVCQHTSKVTNNHQTNSPDPIPQGKSKKGIVIGVISAIVIALIISQLFGKRNATSDGNLEAVDTTMVVEEPSTLSDVILSIPLGTCTYTGEVNADGMPNGQGIAVFNNGDKLVGTFVNGSVSGDGIEYNFSNGDKFYGTIKNDHLSKGRYTVGEDGSYFEGTFENDQPATGHWYSKNGENID